MPELTHFDEQGSSRMVDVGDKDVTFRLARAESFVQMKPETLSMILDRQISKGDVFEVARLAGIMATKRTADLIPLCHPLPIHKVEVQITPDPQLPGYQIQAEVKIKAETGVEMEALTAVSIAALTLYDMCKAVDKTMRIEGIHLAEKTKEAI